MWPEVSVLNLLKLVPALKMPVVIFVGRPRSLGAARDQRGVLRRAYGAVEEHDAGHDGLARQVDPRGAARRLHFTAAADSRELAILHHERSIFDGRGSVTGNQPAPMSRGGVWSPDGTRIAYRRQIGDEHQIVTVRVGTSTAPNVLKRWSVGEPLRLPLAWSPDGRWILIRQGPNLSLLAPDGSSERPLFSTSGSTEFARPIFSRDGREVLILRRDLSAPRRAWKLFATDVASGSERVMTTVDFPRTADNVSGLSLSPDGKRLYTSYADAPFDIWMLEGFQ
jgi:Tol biopolymer transport system component